MANRYFMMAAVFFVMSFFFFCARVSFCQVVKSNVEDAEVIETKVDLDSVNMQKDGEKKSAASDGHSISEEDILKLNRNLKKVIDENGKLLQDRKVLEEQMKMLRGQAEVEHNRANLISVQRDAMENKNKEDEAAQKRTQEQLEGIQGVLIERERQWTEKFNALGNAPPDLSTNAKTPTAKNENPSTEEKVKIPIAAVKKDVGNMVARINKMNQENERLKHDTGKVHYNMGNIFFQKGQYKEARAEYRQAVALMPYDAAAHFNLAFVSGDYLDDPQTALEHYQRYLYLNPDAQDASLVKEKITADELELRTKIDSTLDPLKQQEAEHIKSEKQDKALARKNWLLANPQNRKQ